MTKRPDGDAEQGHVTSLLDAASSMGRKIAFWWRDDDAETVTPALERLLDVRSRFNLPLALAVVPKEATADLSRRLAGDPGVAVLQHGWRHRNHAPAGEKKMELGDHRLPAIVLDELSAGFARLNRLFPSNFVPVLAPPWNRIGDTVEAEREAIGLAGLSTFGPETSGAPHVVNTHVDIFAWRPERRALSRAEVFALLASEVERRLSGGTDPIGILTHHLRHEAESWSLLDELFGLLATHPAIVWPQIPDLFGLAVRST